MGLRISKRFLDVLAGMRSARHTVTLAGLLASVNITGLLAAGVLLAQGDRVLPKDDDQQPLRTSLHTPTFFLYRASCL